jgi:two-component system, cell cycle sensor histidine kinase and response regulator CckA
LRISMERTDGVASVKSQDRSRQLQVLVELAGAVSRARDSADIYRAAVDGLIRALGADRASVLMFEADGVTRFKSWVGLSDQYRAAVEGRARGKASATDAQPIAVSDVLQDISHAAYREVLVKEGIGAVAFVPLLSKGGLIGRFALYYNAPHEFHPEELEVAQAIAAHVAFAAERQQAETALRVSEERFRVMFLQAGVGIAQISLEGKWLLLNDRFCEILGYTQAELHGKTYLEVTHPDDRAKNLTATNQMIAGEISSWSTEKRSIRKDGVIVWARLFLSLVRDPDGHPQYFVAVVEDITEKVQAELTLRESEQRLALALSAARLGVWDCNLQTKEVVLSPISEMYHCDPLSRADWLSLIHPDDRERVVALAHKSLEGSHQWEGEFRVVLHDGSIRWMYSKATVLVDDAGEPVRMVGVSQDVTEREQAEAKLRESEERFRNVADTAPVMIWVTGPDKQFTFFNKTWLNFTGRTMEQEVGSGWAAGVHPDDLPRCYETFSSAFDARRSFQTECRLRRADGEYRSVLCSGVPRFARGGIFAGYIGSVIDITDLQSEERFRQLAENIDQVFWMLDLATNQVLYVSAAFEKVWGCSSVSLYQNSDWLVEAVHAEDRDRFVSFREKMRTEPVEESYRIVRPDGSVRWIHDRTFLVSDPEGKPYRVAGIAEDVTAQRELEEQLRQAHKMEAIGRLAGGIAHDFNNLLTIIIGHSHRLLDRTHLEEARRERLEQILGAANRASILTSQLLAFSRRQVLQPRLVNVNRLLANMEALLRRIIGEHINIETALDPALSCIKIDPNQLEQVVMNLATNARDAMPNSGVFRIETSMADATDKQREDSPCGTGRCVRLRIGDTGCGMDTRTRERAFEPYFTTKGLGKGTGLGLSTVYGIVRQNQGAIHVSSEPGQGTVFDLYFPAAAESEAEREQPASRPRKAEAAATILVAEDEPAVRVLVTQTLEQLGYNVLEATDGYEALNVIERRKGEIDLLLTDVIMPLMNGQELAKRLESIRPAAKVLYMSGYTDEVLAFHGIAQPKIDLIQKPFTASELAGKVEMMLSTNRRERQ